MKVELVAITKPVRENIDDPELLTVEIARVSSSREDKTENPVPLINYLIDHSHWSPFEHAYMTVEIETSRAIGTQILRHRSFTFQELSQRYKNLSNLDSTDLFEEIELRQKGSTNRQGSLDTIDPEIYPGLVASLAIESNLNHLLELYQKLVDEGVAPECARMILPLCTKTTIYMTGSIRSWIHFLAQRMDDHAQKEIRLIAYEIWDIFQSQFPIISKALLTDESKIWSQYETRRIEEEKQRN